MRGSESEMSTSFAARSTLPVITSASPATSAIGSSGTTGLRRVNGVRYGPWSLVVSMEFPNMAAAIRFEKYLKSGSGRAFTKRHFDCRTLEVQDDREA
jgi:hypothetical protein